MHPTRPSKPINYRNISLALLAVVFIQATVIVQLYFVSSSCQQTVSTVAKETSASSLAYGALKGTINALVPAGFNTEENSVAKKSSCGTLTDIPIGEENAMPFGISDIATNLVYPTSDIMLSGEMVSDGPVTAYAVRNHQFSNTYYNDATGADEWIIAAVNREYIKMLQITIKKDHTNALVVYATAAGYLNIYSLHSFGSSTNIENIQTRDLTSNIVRHAWTKRVVQELHGYRLSVFNFCVCEALETTLPTTKFDAVVIAAATNDAKAIVLTDSQTTLGGSHITNGPIACKVFRSTNIEADATSAHWLIAAVNDDYIKIVEVTVSQATTLGSLAVYASNSGYAMYQEFGSQDTDSLNSRVVNAAWNKHIPNTYDVTGLSYYSQNDDVAISPDLNSPHVGMGVFAE